MLVNTFFSSVNLANCPLLLQFLSFYSICCFVFFLVVWIIKYASTSPPIPVPFSFKWQIGVIIHGRLSLLGPRLSLNRIIDFHPPSVLLSSFSALCVVCEFRIVNLLWQICAHFRPSSVVHITISPWRVLLKRTNVD